jgi:energy-coupling factor transporter ATP-binding protein EcfA2
MTVKGSSNGSASATDEAARGGVLELRAITAGYGRTTVLRNINLSVPSGSVVALLGPNGAGKTTLLRTAAGLLSPSAGQVLIGAEAVTRHRGFERSPAPRASAAPGRRSARAARPAMSQTCGRPIDRRPGWTNLLRNYT